jgi:hypothetical protein
VRGVAVAVTVEVAVVQAVFYYMEILMVEKLQMVLLLV